MKQLKLSIKADSKQSYLVAHLKVLNAFLPNPLKYKELVVLAHLMAIPVDNDIYRFSTIAYKAIRKELKLSPSGLSNYIKDLMEKSMIIVNEDGNKTIPSKFYPLDNNQSYLIHIKYEK